ncbi:hypothetical protein GJ496_007954 [Pomphorhynchus laevis]|nr:hypothetical protein GJ496_007954 [Pomphorhynchus laevis]
MSDDKNTRFVFMNTANLYEILQVSKDATDEDIKKAYRTQAFKYHPDKHPNDPTANDKIREINYAHLILKDPTKRKIYDQYGNMGLNMMNQIGEENMSIFLISQNPLFKWTVLGLFFLSCCCYGCFCCCGCFCNFCCGKCVPTLVKQGYDEMQEEARANDAANKENDSTTPIVTGKAPNETAIPMM